MRKPCSGAVHGALTTLAKAKSNGMIYRTLGRTGERVSAIGLGGYHLGHPKDLNDAIRIVRSAVGRGITFLDNCWDYHGGESERRMGLALRDGYRQKAFLMTKFDGRTRVAAASQIEQSLQLMEASFVILPSRSSLPAFLEPDLFRSAPEPQAIRLPTP